MLISTARLFAFFFLAALLTALGARAQEKDAVTYLQMAGITAVAASASGQRATIPVTVVLQAASVNAASEVCRRIPSVRASIMAVSSRTPIPFAKGKLDSEAVSDAVANEINTAIALKAVIRAGFIHGTPKNIPDTATDVVDPGDVSGQKQNMKSGTAGQTAPCRRIASPPSRDRWAVAVQRPEPRGKGVAPSPPSLRDRAPPPPPAAAPFETHPQFAPKK
jgi:hypothetical protein